MATRRLYCFIFVLHLALRFMETEQLSLTNLIDISKFIPIKKLLESYNDTLILVEEIAELEKDNGLEKYQLGLRNEDTELNITQLIKKYGYKVEEHTVITSDGYVLTMYRIPGDGPPALLMHGLLNSADDFITVGPNKALPYLLSNAGYDIWLGNARGTYHSRKNVRLSVDKDKAPFFDYSWHEIGYYDLPAMIDYILNNTGEKSLNYVGHSQGTTSFFVMCSERPEYNKKIKLMVAMSAVVYMSNLVSPIVRILLQIASLFDIEPTSLGLNEVPTQIPLVNFVTKWLCGNTELASLICSNLVFLGSGFDYGQLNVSNTPVIFSHTPSGASMKQLYHYGQGVNSGKFRQYNHGILKNLHVYGSAEPPEYKLENVNAPVAILYSKYNDWLSAFEDVEKLIKRIQNVVELYEVPWEKFCHMDFLWAKDVDKLVYEKVLELFAKYNI